MRNKVLLPLITAFLLLQCTSKNDKNTQKIEKISTELTRSQISVGSFTPNLNFSNSKTSLSKEEKEKLKNSISLREVLSKNIAFTENRGQLENYYNVNVGDLGKVKFYTKGFGGTAYFTEKGIGIGFMRGRLDDITNLEEEQEHEEEETEEDELEEIRERYKNGYYQSIGFNIYFKNSNPKVKVEGINPSVTKLNYLKGNDETKFVKDVSNFEGVIYKEIYKNIDLKYYLHNQDLNFEYLIKPNGKVNDIRLKYSDLVKGLSVNVRGELEVETDWGILRDKKLYSYQIIDGKKKEVNVVYKVFKGNEVGFSIKGSYDPTKDLIIDPPVFSWGTFINGHITGDDGYFEDIGMDASGNLYGAGWAHYSIFPATVTTYSNATGTNIDAIVFKLSADGTTLIYGTFVGGAYSDVYESGMGIDISTSNEAYVAGRTLSSDFPTTAGCYDNSYNNGADIFVLRLNSSGNTLQFSTYYGGTGDEGGYDLVLNKSTNDSYITGYTNSSGIGTVGSYSAGYDAYVLKFNSSGSRQFFTYYGGSGDDNAKSIDVNSSGDVFIAGMTTSSNIPSITGKYKTSITGASDAYVAKINSSGVIQYASYLGGSNSDMASAVRVTSTGDIVVGGITDGPTFPTTANAIQPTSTGSLEAYLTRFSSDLSSLVYSTYVKGTGAEGDKGWVMDPLQYWKPVGLDVVGETVLFTTVTGSTDMLMVNATDNSQNGAYDYYIGIYTYSAPNLTQNFGTYLGGNFNDYPTAGIIYDSSTPNGCFFVGGSSHSTDNTFPTTAGEFQPTSQTSVQTGGGAGSDQSNIVKFCYPEVLPVSFASFDVTYGNNGISMISWTTSMERNNDYFIIEKSYDGINFFPVANVKGKENSSLVSQYKVSDDSFTQSSYYRIKQVDVNGESGYSVVRFLAKTKADLLIYPNPAKDQITIQTEMDSYGSVNVEILNELGQIVLTSEDVVSEGTYLKQLNISDLSKGVYLVKVKTNDALFNQKIVKE